MIGGCGKFLLDRREAGEVWEKLKSPSASLRAGSSGKELGAESKSPAAVVHRWEKQVPFGFAQGRLSALSPRCARLRALGMTGSIWPTT